MNQDKTVALTLPPAGGAVGERLVGESSLHGGGLHQRPPGHGGKHCAGDGLHRQRQVTLISH